MRAALGLALVLGTVTTASADGLYFTESVGGSNVKNELGTYLHDTMAVRFAVGYRFRSWAVEGFFSGDLGTKTRRQPAYALRCDCAGGGDNYGGGYDYPSSGELTTAGVNVKYLRPLNDTFEVYLRGSLGNGWFDNYAGRGLGLGAGVQLKGKVRALGFLFFPMFFVPWGPKVTGALYVDTGADFYRLHKGGDIDNPDAIDASISRITIGWSIGSDF